MRTFREFVATNDMSRTDLPDNGEGNNNAGNQQDSDAIQHLMRAVKKAVQIDPIKLASLIEREFSDQEIEDAIIQFKNNKGSLKKPGEDGLGNLSGDNLDSVKIGGEHPDASGGSFGDD